MDKSRRTLIRNLGVIGLGASMLPFYSCEKEPESFGVEIFENYNPNLNNPPYVKREFNVEEKITNLGGEIIYDENPGKIIVRGKISRKHIEGIKGIRYGMKKNLGSDNYFDFVQDPSGVYMPGFVRNNGLGHSSFQLLRKGNLPLINESLRISKAEGNLNSYNPRDINEFIKGFVNKGQRQITSDVDFIRRMKKGELFLANIDNGKVGVASILPGLEIAGLQKEYFIPVMNRDADLGIKDGKNYQFFEMNFKDFGSFLLFYDPKNHIEKESVDIKNLFPLQSWNSWKYNNDLTWKAVYSQQSGFKNINDCKFIYFQNSEGLKEYYGFEGLELKLFGGSNSGLDSDEVVFSPGITLGDNEVKIGKKYPIHSNVLINGFDGFGIVKGEVYWDKKEDKILHKGDLNNQETFGDCYRLNRNIGIKLERNGESYWENVRSRTWFAENVGPILEEEIDLVTGEVLKSYSLLEFDVSGINNSDELESSKKSASINKNFSEGILNGIFKNLEHFK
jgi:hypothetical protein